MIDLTRYSLIDEQRKTKASGLEGKSVGNHPGTAGEMHAGSTQGGGAGNSEGAEGRSDTGRLVRILEGALANR